MRYTLVIFLLLYIINCKAQDILELKAGKISFVSDAPLEIIKAENEAFQFLLDTVKNEFAISIPINKFNGFNSALQKEHFFENYMEIDRFPKAIFTGKTLDKITYRKEAFKVIVRGQLSIHGITKERIIEAECQYKNKKELFINSIFEIPLEEHDIEIPRIVFQKIAEIITVSIHAELIPKK